MRKKRIIEASSMRIAALLGVVHRILDAAMLCVLACVPIYIASEALWRIVKSPPGTPIAAIIAVAICVAVAYFLVVLAWRAVTGRSPRKDGGLLAPLVLQAFAVILAFIGIIAFVLNFTSGKYLQSLGAVVFLPAAATIFEVARRRRTMATKVTAGVPQSKSDAYVPCERRIQDWTSEVGIPIFIPPEGQAALRRTEVNSPRSLSLELARLAALGCNWAAAALATILLYPDKDGRRDLDAARKLVDRPASDGDAYSQYVLGWVELLSGNQERYLHLLNRAARAGFGAALVDLAAAFERTRGGLAESFKLLKLAASKGHLVARGRIFLLWMRARAGWLYIVPGVIGFAITWARVTVKYRRDPVSAHIFCFRSQLRAPPIRRHGGEEETAAV